MTVRMKNTIFISGENELQHNNVMTYSVKVPFTNSHAFMSQSSMTHIV